MAVPARGQDQGDSQPATVETLPDAIEYWTLPGEGAGPLVVNDGNGTLWTFFHQTGNLVALSAADGSALLDVPMSISPTALAFTPDWSLGFLAGEPLDDQIIDVGVVQAIDATSGVVLGEIELEGSCNAVCAADGGILYAACGMQYGYEGTIYRLSWKTAANGAIAFAVETQATCGKVPWAIALYDNTLYVTDLELQWTAQPDGTMGPPYGSWVWEYDPESLELNDRSWVGINPSRLGVTEFGVLAGCSGSKQSEGEMVEPSLSLIGGPGGTEPIVIGTTGASDLAVAPDGTWAVVSLSDWASAPPWSAAALLQNLKPGTSSQAMRWVYTGDLAYVAFEDGKPVAQRTQLFTDSFIRAVAVSTDGTRIYALQSEPERIAVIPVDMIM